MNEIKSERSDILMYLIYQNYERKQKETVGGQRKPYFFQFQWKRDH